jgi:uncharacterized protein YlaN (UPF0358 family)
LNGRFFSEDISDLNSTAEIMQSIFLSDVYYTTSKINQIIPESLLALPTCPLCLEKLDCSVTGLSQTSTILHESIINVNNSNSDSKVVP